MTEIPNFRTSDVEHYLSQNHMPRLKSAVSLLDVLVKRQRNMNISFITSACLSVRLAAWNKSTPIRQTLQN